MSAHACAAEVIRRAGGSGGGGVHLDGVVVGGGGGGAVLAGVVGLRQRLSGPIPGLYGRPSSWFQYKGHCFK